MTQIAQFYQKHCSPFDRLFYILLLLTMVTGILLTAINQLFTHYQGVPYAKWHFFLVIFALIGLSALSKAIKAESPRLYTLVHSYSQYWVLIIANTLLLQGIQYTPFPTIDTALLAFDQWLYFDTTQTLQWVHQHNLTAFFMFFYDLLTYELFFLPGIIGFFVTRYRFKRFLLAYVLATIIAELIYYFIPTEAPASLLSSPLFPDMAQQTHIKFEAVHQAIKYLYPPGTGGLIAFPSLHVISGIMYAYLCMDRRWLFGLIGAANTLMILATVLLGWHYLVDLLAAVVIATVCILISHRWIDHIEKGKAT